MTTRNMTDVKWEEIRSNKKKGTIFAAMESVFTGVSLFSILYIFAVDNVFTSVNVSSTIFHYPLAMESFFIA